MKKHFLLSVSLIIVLPGLHGQDDYVYKMKDILPPSPEVSAFAKNANIPVSYVTGTPQINIPFASVKSGAIEIPVSLSYNASGIRVEEVPSWVGLGWNLNAGGQVSRTVRDKPDEQGTYGYMVTPYYRSVRYMDSVLRECGDLGCIQCIEVISSEAWAIEHDYNIYGILDAQPDEYNFSLMGYSGKFYYNQDSARFILVPYQNVKIEGSPLTGSFTLTLPDGVKGYFGDCTDCREVWLNGTTTSYIDHYSQSPVAMGNAPHTTTWYLTEVVDPAGRSVRFNYTPETVITYGRGGERFGQTITDDSYTIRRQSFFKQYIKKAVLDNITGESGNIFFKRSSASRQDMPDYLYGARSLDTIVVTTVNNTTLKSFYFDYDYFTSPDTLLYGVLDISSYLQEARKRLYLKSIREKNGSDSLPPYVFTYDETVLPNRFSTAQDYWGYYNGKLTGGMYLMPRIPQLPFYLMDPYYNQVNQNLPPYGEYRNPGNWADRRTDTNYNQAGVLKKIEYPTGGTAEYFYETNEAVPLYNLDIYGGMEAPDMIDRSYSLTIMSNPLPTEPPYPLYFPGTFTINIPVTKLKIIPQLPTCTTYADASCILEVKLRSLPDSALITTINTTSAFQVQLPGGQYLAEVFVDASPDAPPPEFNVTFQWGERLDSLAFKAGGLRVKKIIANDSAGGTVTRGFSYKYDETGESSGKLEGIPVFKVYDFNCMMQPIRQYYESNSVLPLSQEGRTLRYHFVSEFCDTAQSSFRTDYAFTSGLADPLSFFGGAQSGAPLLNWNWQHGLLKKKDIFEKAMEGGYRPLSSEEHYYQFYDYVTELYGLYGGQALPYSITTEWYLPTGVTTTTYVYADDVPDSVKTTINYTYNDHYLPSLSSSVSSKGEAIHSKTWYPADYDDVSGFNIPALYSKHIWTVPVRQETSVNGKIRSGSIARYDEWGRLLDGYSYEHDSPADTAAHDRDVVLGDNYNLKMSIRYDSCGNISEVNNNKSGPAAYIWDYHVNGLTGAHINELPIALLQNADSASVAYTSFEADGKGGWTFSGSANGTYSVTGGKSYLASGGDITKPGLASATYIVSYWGKGGSVNVNTAGPTRTGKTIGDWTYYEHELATTSITVSGSNYIDELRLYPKGAMMTTYTYKYGAGFSSQCGPTNRIVYYEYDDLQRLCLIRNEDRHILKKICYNYAGQPVSCGYDTIAAWTAISSVCEQDEDVNTGNLIITEKDMNPSSSTYNQTRTITIASGGACIVCNELTCSNEDKKCINGVCETGTKVYTGTVRTGQTTWICYYHYLWSDSSTSATYEEQHEGPCIIL